MTPEEVTLIGKTLTGKITIERRGANWTVIGTSSNHPETNSTGTWLSLAPSNDPLDTRPLWVQSHNDTDFIVTFNA